MDSLFLAEVNKLQIILSILFITLSHWQVNAQQIKGMVIDPVNQDTLSETTIYNQNKDLSTLSNAQGYFQIMAHKGDTIHFLQAGYFPKILIVKSHHYWDQLHIQLPRHTILLQNNLQMQAQLRQIAEKLRKPIFINGLSRSENIAKVKPQLANLSQAIIADMQMKAEIKEAYQLSEKQLEKLIIMFHEQQKKILIHKNDREIISYFLQFVDAKARQRISE